MSSTSSSTGGRRPRPDLTVLRSPGRAWRDQLSSETSGRTGWGGAHPSRGDGERAGGAAHPRVRGVVAHVRQHRRRPLHRPHRVVWDMRGHGRSDSPEDPAAYSVGTSLDAMLAILDDVGAERAVLVGHSLGGYLSLELAIAHPERVAALVLVDTGPGYPQRSRPRRVERDGRALRPATSTSAGLDGLPGSDELTAGVHRSADGLALAARGVLRQSDGHVLEALPTIAVPTLVVVGERDDAVPRRVAVHGRQDPRRSARRHRRLPATPRRSATPMRSTPCCARSSPGCGSHDDARRRASRGPGLARRALGPRRSPSSTGAACSLASGWATPTWPDGVVRAGPAGLGRRRRGRGDRRRRRRRRGARGRDEAGRADAARPRRPTSSSAPAAAGDHR